MRLHEIILPMADNSGAPCAEALARFEAWACRTYGGFTAIEVQGAWADASGKLYIERNVAYRIATNETFNAMKSATIAKARELFPDQLAFCVAELGAAFIVPVDNNPHVHAWKLRREGKRLIDACACGVEHVIGPKEA